MIRAFLALTCCLALTATVGAAEEPDINATTDSTTAKAVKAKPVKTQVHSGQFKTDTSTLPAAQSNTNVKKKGPGEAEAYTAEGSSEKTSQFKKQKSWNANNFKTGTGDLPAAQSDTNVQTSSSAQFKKLKVRKEWDSNNSTGDPRTHYLGTGETDAPKNPQWKGKNWKQSSGPTNADINVQQNSQWKGKNWSKKGGSGNFQGQVNANQAWKIKKFSSLHKSSGIPRAQFSINARIHGSDKWQGNQYNAFRIYSSQRHDRDWWRSRHNRIVLVGGGYYYWDNGYWYPAWGYDPSNEFYAYDGPIFGYNDLPPDQVIANVQAALQEQGYYEGEVDGLLGPLTRAALAGYQRDHGLYTTSAIDQPTLESLGMT